MQTFHSNLSRHITCLMKQLRSILLRQNTRLMETLHFVLLRHDRTFGCSHWIEFHARAESCNSDLRPFMAPRKCWSLPASNVALIQATRIHLPNPAALILAPHE